MKKKLLLLLISFAGLFQAICQNIQKHEVIHLRNSIYVIRPNHPKYGNPSSVVSIGKEGVFIADVGPLEYVPNLIKSIQNLGGKEVNYITLSHHHGDHTEGLEYFKSNKTVKITTQNQRGYLKNSRIFLNGDGHKKESLPNLIFNEKLTLFINKEEIELFTGKNKNGHTGGDIFIYFKTSNILYLGDYVFLNHFPIIDTKNGGSVDGFLDNLKHITEEFSENVVVVPGHGTLSPKEFKLTTVKDLKKYHKNLLFSVNWIKSQIKNKKSLKEIQDSKLPELFTSFDKNAIYIKSKTWIKIVYNYYTKK